MTNSPLISAASHDTIQCRWQETALHSHSGTKPPSVLWFHSPLEAWRSSLDHLCPARRRRRSGCGGLCGRFYGPSLEVACFNFLHLPWVTKHQGRLGDVVLVCNRLNSIPQERYLEIQTSSSLQCDLVCKWGLYRGN